MFSKISRTFLLVNIDCFFGRKFQLFICTSMQWETVSAWSFAKLGSVKCLFSFFFFLNLTPKKWQFFKLLFPFSKWQFYLLVEILERLFGWTSCFRLMVLLCLQLPWSSRPLRSRTRISGNSWTVSTSPRKEQYSRQMSKTLTGWCHLSIVTSK